MINSCGSKIAPSKTPAPSNASRHPFNVLTSEVSSIQPIHYSCRPFKVEKLNFPEQVS